MTKIEELAAEVEAAHSAWQDPVAPESDTQRLQRLHYALCAWRRVRSTMAGDKEQVDHVVTFVCRQCHLRRPVAARATVDDYCTECLERMQADPLFASAWRRSQGAEGDRLTGLERRVAALEEQVAHLVEFEMALRRGLGVPR